MEDEQQITIPQHAQESHGQVSGVSSKGIGQSSPSAQPLALFNLKLQLQL